MTNDIAVALRTPTQHAEDIKIKYACALEQLARNDESIQVPSVGDRTSRQLARQTLAQVVEARYRELFSLIQAELRRSGFENMIAAGLVMTGGASRIEGAEELAEEIFHMPVRLATAAVRDRAFRRGEQRDPCDRRGPAALRQPGGIGPQPVASEWWRHFF